MQLIAANVDTLLFVTSANQDFNLARLERYLALALEARGGAGRRDHQGRSRRRRRRYVAAGTAADAGALVEAIDARGADAARVLAPWFGRGQTLALLGSSGVGKSTLVNSLSGRPAGDAGHSRGRREGTPHDDRAISASLGAGAWLMDTPGMRELQLIDVADGIDEVFEDVTQLIAACRFSDCTHASEPGCAVRAALETARSTRSG